MLYDSYIANESTDNVMRYTECLPVLIPRLMRIGTFTDDAYDLTPYSIERVLEGVPQQPQQSGTCGIFAARFIEFLSFDVPLRTLDDQSVETLRERFALDCYRAKHLVGTKKS
jgi:hypothetical protein